MFASRQIFGISLQLWIRFWALLGFSALLTRHILYFPVYMSYSNQPSGILLWALEASILLGYCFAYLLRRSARATAEGWKEVIFPFVPAALPFLFFFELDLSFPLDMKKIFGSSVITQPDYLWLGLVLIFSGNLITSIALWTLRSSFSIMTESRELVRNGIYRFVSHPMYLGQFITFFGVMFLRLTSQKCILYALFVTLQWIRLKNEEKKLMQSFKDYDEHLRACWIRF